MGKYNNEGGIFWTQLKTLLWKNFTLKRRGWGFLLLEVIWPLVLFVVIVSVRHVRPAVDKPACHIQPKALPSAGLLPFLQSLFCTLENKCFQTAPENMDNEIPIDDLVNSFSTLFSDDRFTDNVQWLIDEGIEPLLLPGGFFNVSAVDGLSPDTRDALEDSRFDLAGFLTQDTAEHLAETLVNAVTGDDPVQFCYENGTFPTYIRLPADADKEQVQREVCGLENEQLRKLISPAEEVLEDIVEDDRFPEGFIDIYNAIDESGVVTALSETQVFIFELLSLSGTEDGGNPLSGALSKYLSQFICGIDDVLAIGIGDLGDLEEVEQQASELGFDVEAEEYVRDDEISDFCNDVFEQFQENVVLSNLWKYAKPIIIGKILYTPQDPATQRIIAQINKTFEEVANAFEALDMINDTREELFQQLYDYFEDPNANDIPFLTFIVDIAPSFVDFEEINETADEFFSNDPDVQTWQDLFNETFDILSYFDDLSTCFSTDRFMGFETEQELEDYAAPRLDDNKIWAGLVFQNTNPDSEEIPKLLKYKIRMRSGRVDDTDWIIDDVWFPDPRRNPVVDLKPVTSGQIYLTDLLEKAVIDLQASSSYKKTGTWIKQFPSPCYKQDEFLYAIAGTMPLFMTLAWLFSVGMIVKGIVYEKETRLKEVMKVMGLGNTIHWISWFVTSFVILFSAGFVLSFILKFGDVLAKSNVFVIMFVFFSYVIPTITFCFLISVFFSRANLASAVAGITFFVFYLPYVLYIAWSEDIDSNGPKFLLCFSSNVAFGFACTYFAYFEQQGEGVQWSNLGKSPIYQDDFSMGKVLFMMYFDALVYLLLALYIEQVKPGTYGVPKKWYFPFQLSFWCPDRANRFTMGDVNFDPDLKVTGENMETEPNNIEVGVQIRDLVKVYSTGNKLAVNGLSINFYKNQITSFLGHNGAGKTTTMSILTGLFPPTSGTGFVNGLDIREHMDVIRQSVGMCPQYNVLFGNLTVMEHLRFYGRLRGKRQLDITKMGIRLLSDLHLSHKSDDMSKNLSGGMKRKLSVAISFIGDNKTVILDEPTAGVDPHSRRGIWELLSKYKEGRTIILSTHHMDEADVLGDRIAIIANGQLQCCGSSIYLRRKYGSGYQLTLAREVKPEATNRDLSERRASFDPAIDGPYEEKHAVQKSQFDRDSEKMISKFIRSIFPDVELAKNIGTELTYTLPYSGLSSGIYTKLFRELEMNKISLGISDYGLSDSSLEDIFIEVADQAPDSTKYDDRLPKKRSKGFRSIFADLKKRKVKNDQVSLSANGTVHYDNSGRDSDTESEASSSNGHVVFKDSNRSKAKNFANENVPKVTGGRLKWLQFQAMYIKRFHHIRKDRKAFFSQILLPALFVLLAMIFTLIVPGDSDQEPLVLQPYMYGDDNYIFYADSSTQDEREAMRQLTRDMASFPHHSTRCIDGYGIGGHPCKPGLQSEFIDPGYSSGELIDCDCSSGYQVCPDDAEGGDPDYKTLSTTEILQDLTGRDISDFLMKTRDEYKLRRFYGFEFEGESNDYDFNENDFVQATLDAEDLVQDNDFLSYNYSNGFQWEDVINDLNSVLNDSIAIRNIKVWWNNKGHHMLLSSTNALNNLILRNALPNTTENRAQYGIVSTTHPFKLTVSQLTDDLLERSGRDLIVGICVIFALSFVPASFVLYLISERTSKAKHLQYVSGVNPTIFWVSTFAWDLTNYLLPALICIFIFVCFQTESYVSGANFPCLCLLLLLYGFSITPLMYPFAYLFSVPSTAYVLLTGLNAFIGINCTTATYILDFFPDDKGLQNTNNALKKIFLVFPQYCLGRGLFEMALNQLTADALSEFGEYEFKSPLTYNIAGKHIFAMFMQGLCFFALVLVIEHLYVFRRLYLGSSRGANKHIDEEEEIEAWNHEEDVKEEEHNVNNGLHDGDPVVVKRLRKVYRLGAARRPLVAVKNLSFHVPKGECFGLLGVNGAGKTSTFNMLTGDNVPTAGSAHLAGFDVQTQLNDSRKRLGFCPQFDALDALLSVREHLMLYARLRGIEAKSVNIVTEGVIEKMGLKKYRDKQAGTLSGGNKRKLSTAIALIGNPQIIFLDEPTSGMDPKARRYLWQCIHDAVQEGRSVVLTSHSMEECEALCTRLAIMVNGHFKCLGSTQHIKTKYGNGYVIHVKMQVGLGEFVQNYFMQVYPNAEVLDNLPSLIVFQVPQEDSSLSGMFEAMERGKQMEIEVAEEGAAQEVVAGRMPGSSGSSALNPTTTRVPLIEDYSISQTTLDQVFINFASEQNDDMVSPSKQERGKGQKKKFKPLPNKFMQVNGNYYESVPEFTSISTTPSAVSTPRGAIGGNAGIGGNRGKGVQDDDGLLDNISIASGDSQPSSAASLKHKQKEVRLTVSCFVTYIYVRKIA
ncbi:phospholipid-transporting ATPase ABCA1-like isoform X2 [Convolutriloba macropyga]|uniref:phospholipid-transporting ATPase ABCA1-like isoform X2 n=1 Tax=Convolutriloba macropyga TaxID=536237 RepID=UPI003F523346